MLFTFLRRPVKRVQWPAPVLWRWMGGLLQGLCRPWPQRDLVSEQQNPQKPQQETQKPTFRWGGLCLPGGVAPVWWGSPSLSGGVASVRWDGPCFQVGWPRLSVRWGGSSQSGGVAPVCQVGWPVCQVGWPHLTTSTAEAVENERAVSHAGYRWPHSRSPTSPTLVCQRVVCFVSCLRKAVHCLPQKTCSLVI